MPVYVSGEQKITYPISISQGGTGNTSFTTGSIIFMGETALAEDNSVFFYDRTNSRMGIHTNTPEFALDVVAGEMANGHISVDGTSDGTYRYRRFARGEAGEELKPVLIYVQDEPYYLRVYEARE